MRWIRAALPLAALTLLGAGPVPKHLMTDEPVLMRRAALKPLEGVWELKTVPTEGYQGTVRMTVALYKADGDAPDFGRLEYAFDLADGQNQIRGDGAPKGGVSFGVVKRGAGTALVTSKQPRQPAPFKVEATDALATPFEVKDDVLTLDVSRSLEAFVPGFLTPLKIDWIKTRWERVKK